jgi:Fe-S oxidoreductase
LNTLRNEYPAFGGRYEVLHHTQFIARLAEEGRLPNLAASGASVTYHDPCFLARANGETSAPRSLLSRTGVLQEPERRKCKAFCCGAGGGRMWMEEAPDQRPGLLRARELVDTGADSIAVGCPFCKVMVGDSVAQLGIDSAPAVRDVAEVYLEAVRKAEEPSGV